MSVTVISRPYRTERAAVKATLREVAWYSSHGLECTVGLERRADGFVVTLSHSDTCNCRGE